MRRVTVILPKRPGGPGDEGVGQGFDGYSPQGLESILVAGACRRIRQRRGKVHLSINVDELREDRRIRR
jgi:hypothetical protein